jgi:hypothetical protein
MVGGSLSSFFIISFFLLLFLSFSFFILSKNAEIRGHEITEIHGILWGLSFRELHGQLNFYVIRVGVGVGGGELLAHEGEDEVALGGEELQGGGAVAQVAEDAHPGRGFEGEGVLYAVVRVGAAHFITQIGGGGGVKIGHFIDDIQRGVHVLGEALEGALELSPALLIT